MTYSLPAGIAPWASHLAVLPTDVALALAPWVGRLALAVGPANASDVQAQARAALRPLLATSRNAALSAAAETASSSPAVRVDPGRAVVPPSPPAAAWRLELEALSREVDTGFAAEARLPAVSDAREALVATIIDTQGASHVGLGVRLPDRTSCRTESSSVPRGP